MTGSNKRKGSRLEARLVKDAQAAGLDARRQPGSGVYADYPGDLVIDNTLVECKAGYTRLTVTGEHSFSFRLEWLERTKACAKKLGLDFCAVAFRMDGTNKVYVVMEEPLFFALLERARVQKK